MQYAMGLDLGSRTSKIAVWNGKEFVYTAVADSGVYPAKIAKKLLDNAVLAMQADPGEIAVYATGYGRKTVTFAKKALAEIGAHARGICHFCPTVKTLIDIGGQDAKIICLKENGKVKDFVMNDKCAAGTGRFLEKVAVILETDLDNLALLAQESPKHAEISSACVVFAESEIIGLIAQGIAVGAIAKGAMLSVARRMRNLASPLRPVSPFAFSGGVAQNKAMVAALSEIFQAEIFVPQNPQLCGAMGAALLAWEENETLDASRRGKY